MSAKENQHVFTPPEVARRLRVKADKIIRWIRSGELRAIDVSTHAGIGRPRFRIELADLLAFEAKREVKPRVKTHRRRKPDSEIIEFF